MIPAIILGVLGALHTAPPAKHPPRSKHAPERVTITIEPLPAPAPRYVLPVDRNGKAPLTKT